MVRRFPLILIAALLGVTAVATVALAGVQVGPGAPNAQVGQYVSPEFGGGNKPDVLNIVAEGPSADVGAGGELAFTGFVLLPLVMVGVVLILGAVALRRRTHASPLIA